MNTFLGQIASKDEEQIHFHRKSAGGGYIDLAEVIFQFVVRPRLYLEVRQKSEKLLFFATLLSVEAKECFDIF